MKKVFALIAVLITALVISACTTLVQKDADMEQVTGTLMYRERIALPADARITVTLSDVSKMDAPAQVISRQSFLADGKQVPFAFELNFDRTEIDPRFTYAVSARIEVDGKLMFITDTANHVITDPQQTKKLELMLIRTR